MAPSRGGGTSWTREPCVAPWRGIEEHARRLDRAGPAGIRPSAAAWFGIWGYRARARRQGGIHERGASGIGFALGSALALARRCKRIPDDGRSGSVNELATADKRNRGYLSRTLM